MVGSIQGTKSFGEPWNIIIMKYEEPNKVFQYSHTIPNEFPGIRGSYSIYKVYELEVLTNIFVGEF